MNLIKKNILGIGITVSPLKNILEYIEKYLNTPGQKSCIIVTPNAEQLVLAQKDLEFRKILNQADIAIPDGFPVARLLGVKRIPGVEFMEQLATLAAEKAVPIGLIGGLPGVAVKALECLSLEYLGLKGWAISDVSNLGHVSDLIKANKTRFVFVGLGAPKQEFFIDALSQKVSHCVLMSVGGSFDILSGMIPRAPLFMRLIGFEWLYRLYKEPWRWKRQMVLVKFIMYFFVSFFYRLIRILLPGVARKNLSP